VPEGSLLEDTAKKIEVNRVTHITEALEKGLRKGWKGRR